MSRRACRSSISCTPIDRLRPRDIGTASAERKSLGLAELSPLSVQQCRDVLLAQTDNLQIDVHLANRLALPGPASQVLDGLLDTDAQHQPRRPRLKPGSVPSHLCRVVHELVLLSDLRWALVCPALDKH